MSACSAVGRVDEVVRGALPSSLCAAVRLNELNVRWCGALAALPGRVGDLTGLWRLHLAGCGALQELPASLCQLTGVGLSAHLVHVMEPDMVNCVSP